MKLSQNSPKWLALTHVEVATSQMAKWMQPPTTGSQAPPMVTRAAHLLFEQNSAPCRERLFERFTTRNLKRDIFRIYRVHFSIVEIDFEIDHAITGEDSLLRGLVDALLD